MNRYHIRLSSSERRELESWLKKGVHSAHEFRCARVLLASDENVKRHSAEWISQVYHLSRTSVGRIRKSFAEQGMEMFKAKPRKERSDKRIDEHIEARVVALALSKPPEGHDRWTIRSLTAHVVRQGILEKISTRSIAKILERKKITLHQQKRQVFADQHEAKPAG